MNSPAIIADTPAKIEAYRLLTIKAALSLEVKGLKMSRGIKASNIARDVLKKAGKKAPAKLADLLEAYKTHLQEIKVLVS